MSERVYWVGAVDWNTRNFHGYTTERGTTYNAYLILDERITLIDTVKGPFFEEMMARIASVIDPTLIDCIVSNHAEPDHSGSLAATIAAVAPSAVYCSPTGEKTLKAYYGETLPLTTVKTGDSLKLGKSALHFVETKMLHWPDSMIAYLDTEKLLFSQDAFGMHLAGSSLWADEYPEWILEEEAKKYYANILLHLSPKVQSLLDSLPSLGLDIAMIAPDHGPVWRENPMWIVGRYREYAEQPMKPKALIVYATMWGATEKLAREIGDGIASAGLPFELCNLSVNDRSVVITKIMDSGIVLFGSPTMNNQLFPPVADALTYVKGLRPKNRIGAAFGSYGWSGEAGKTLQAELAAMGFEMPCELLNVKYMPTAEDCEKARAIGMELARTLLQKIAASRAE